MDLVAEVDRLRARVKAADALADAVGMFVDCQWDADATYEAILATSAAYPAAAPDGAA